MKNNFFHYCYLLRGDENTTKIILNVVEKDLSGNSYMFKKVLIFNLSQFSCIENLEDTIATRQIECGWNLVLMLNSKGHIEKLVIQILIELEPCVKNIQFSTIAFRSKYHDDIREFFQI